ncbi:MAG TPA: HRDC domain-containing protein, partial [Kiloniellaceae bacterium]
SLDVAGHGGLSVTPPGAGLLQGQGSFRFRRDTVGKASQRARRAAAATELGDADAALLDALKKLRLDLAKARGVPAYVVFGDRSLVDMARRRPSSHADFAQVFGVGEAKLRDFAEPFLKAIAEFRTGE